MSIITSLRKLKRFVRQRVLRPRPQLPQLRMVLEFGRGGEPPRPALADEYSIVEYAEGMEDDWIGLYNSSGEFGVWTRERLAREITGTLLPGGGGMVTHQGRPVGCAAVCRSPNDQTTAVLNYVVVLGTHRGKGVGLTAVARAVAVARDAGMRRVALLTDDFRLAAIRTYLRLGFSPDVRGNDEESARWDGVLAKLKVPSEPPPRGGSDR